MDLEKELQQGIEHQKNGRLGDAVRHYKVVLTHDPANVDALNLMSVLANSLGDHQTAASLALTAMTEQPDWFLSPLNLGNALLGLGQVEAAVDALQKAVTLNPSSAEAYVNLSDALARAGRAAEAADMAVQAIVTAPDMAAAHINFGNALLALDSPGEALEAYIKAGRLEPGNELAWMNMGNAYMSLGAFEAAVENYRHAIALSDGPVKRFNLGNALHAMLRLDEAREAYARCLEQAPGHLDATINLAAVLRDQGKLDDAERLLREAISRYPDLADLHWNLALVLLTRGDYAEGWTEYEWRWGTAHFARFRRDFDAPAWTGEALSGKSILIHAEQGFGDAIEMSRLVPALADAGARVLLECRPGLGRLLSTLDPRLEVFEVGPAPLPVTDFQLPLMSLPHRLGVTLASVPARIPYLSVPEGAATFPEIATEAGLKVGVVWSGSSGRRDNDRRSFRPHDLLDLLPGRPFSLQMGEAAQTAADLFSLGLMVDLSPRLGDFADTAAAIASLDLVISVDTAVAHLAGALGKRVWLLLPYPTAAFLWMTQRDDSPWYPTMRLFRQSPRGDWAEVFEQVAQSLSGAFS